MSSESKQRKQRGQQQTRRGLPACNFWLDKSAEGWRPGMWGIADEKHAGVVDAKPIWISPCAWLGARLLSRSADGPLFLSGSRQCSRCCGSGFGPGCLLLLFLLAGVLQLQLPLARHPRKSACEAKRNLGCRGLGGALAHPLLPERSGVPRGPLGSSEGLACPEPRRGRQR